MTTKWDWGPTAGAFVGAGIPALLAYLKLRTEGRHRLQDRQWIDAEVMADVQRILTDIDPQRRTMNLNRAEGAEDELWAELDKRRDDVQRRLLVLGTGHSSEQVRTLAQRLAVEVFNAALQSRWTVNDMLRRDEWREQFDSARETHETARATATELLGAIQTAGSGRRVSRKR